MTSFNRWVTFNLVGAVGMIVQLTALALFNGLLHGHYLLASAAALEVTLLHNFVWHTKYTWHDRRDRLSRGQQLLRFQLSNGLVSLGGNLALMRLLVHMLHLPVLLANAIAVLCCSAATFWFSHRWAFPAPQHSLLDAQRSTRTAMPCPLRALTERRSVRRVVPKERRAVACFSSTRGASRIGATIQFSRTERNLLKGGVNS